MKHNSYLKKNNKIYNKYQILKLGKQLEAEHVTNRSLMQYSKLSKIGQKKWEYDYGYNYN